MLLTALAKANNAYSEKINGGKHKEKEMIALSWKVKELDDLGEKGRRLHSDIKDLLKLRENNNEVNVPSRLQTIRQHATAFVKGVVRHQRNAATHILVFMISPEERNKKPYALPVQCLPYKGISDAKVRMLADEIIQEMVKRNMKVAGKRLNCIACFNE